MLKNKYIAFGAQFAKSKCLLIKETKLNQFVNVFKNFV